MGFGERSGRGMLPHEASPEDLAKRVFGLGHKPGVLSEDLRQFRIERATQLVEDVLLSVNYHDPMQVLKLKNVVRDFLIWARAYLGEDSDEEIHDLLERLKSLGWVPNDTRRLARYFEEIMDIYGEAAWLVARGQVVRPEIPIDVRIIGRDEVDPLRELGVGTATREELEKAIAQSTPSDENGHDIDEGADENGEVEADDGGVNSVNNRESEGVNDREFVTEGDNKDVNNRESSGDVVTASDNNQPAEGGSE